jgi:hypothetical protein
MMQQEIGAAAGAIWQALNMNGEYTLPKLKQNIDCTGPVFDWAIGWLAREDKIIVTREKRSFRVKLKDHHRL